MKKQLFALFLALVLLCTLAAPALADGLPEGYWPVWSAFNEARKGSDDSLVLSTGAQLLDFYSRFPRNLAISDQLYLVYYEIMTRQIYENRGDYASAAENLRNLREICAWKTANGDDYAQMVRDLDMRLTVTVPEIEVYAASYTQNETYGSRYAAPSGTVYGAVSGGLEETAASFARRSIVSQYVLLEQAETAADFDWYLRPKADGVRTLMICLNFLHEGETAAKIPTGAYDAKIDGTLNYLATLPGPLLLRIGAEMDVWQIPVSHQTFIDAYRYIALRARALCPNVELIWSPSYAPGYGDDQESYYPGDDVTDWVGVSLYYNDDVHYDLFGRIFYAKGEYCDPIRCAARVHAIAEAHNKPMIVTEGGTIKGQYTGSRDMTWTKEVVAREFSTLNMVYPRIKAMLYFDTVFNGHDYTLTGDLYTAADSAARQNPALIQAGEKTAATWVPIATFDEPVTGSLLLGAAGRTYRSNDIRAEYRVDGVWKAAPIGAPNHFWLDLDALPYGKHRLTVRLDDNQGYVETRDYTLDYSSDDRVLITAGYAQDVARCVTVPVTFNGEKIALNGFALTNAVGGVTNYVLLRDIAALLDGTGSQFDVDWDGVNRLILLRRDSPYLHPNGSEGKQVFTANRPYKLLENPVSLDGAPVKLGGIVLTADNGGGYTYFKLRDLGTACGFTVDWTPTEGVSIKTR